MSADWNDTDGATEYLVQWRLHGPGNALNAGIRPTTSNTDITVADYGRWVIRVRACNSVGCSAPAAQAVTVIEQPNRAPTVNSQTAQHTAFTDTTDAPRGTPTVKGFAGIFTDPDGDNLTYTVTIPDDRSELAETINVDPATSQVTIQLDGDDNWKTTTRTLFNGFVMTTPRGLPDPLTTTVTLTATDPDGLSASISGDFSTDWASHPVVVDASSSTWWIELTFDEELQVSPSPAAGQFTVNTFASKEASAEVLPLRRVQVHPHSSTISLYVDDPIEAPYAITVDYTHDDDNPLKRASAGGGAAPSFTGQSVPVPAPEMPMNIVLESTPGELSIAATWDERSRASTYRVTWQEVDGTADPENELIVSEAGASVTIADYGEWEVNVEACNVSGCGPSASETVIVRQYPLAGLTVGAVRGELAIQAAWQAVSGASSYKLRWRPAGDTAFPEANQATTTETEATLAVSDYGHWEVALEACDDSGCSQRDAATAGVLAQGYVTPVCDRTPGVRDALEWETGKDCDSITAADLAALGTDDYHSLTIGGYVYRDGWTRTPPLTTVRTGDFDGLSNLTHLMLGGNELTSLPGGIFHGLSSLIELSLSRNDLTVLPDGVFDDLTSLKTLHLHYTKLTTLRPDVFDELSNLRSLYLRGTDLTELPAGIFDSLSNLTWLEVSSNDKLSSLPAGVFDELDSLTEVLNLGGNNLATLPAGAFKNLSNLKALWLWGNGMTELPANAFEGLSGDTYLYLNHNNLTTLPADAFDGSPNLKRLALYNNQLTTLPDGVFDSLTKMTGLYLENNKLDALPDGVFDGMSSLMWLDLRSNSLPASAVSSALFEELNDLERLRLSDNPGYPFDLNLGQGIEID